MANFAKILAVCCLWVASAHAASLVAGEYSARPGQGDWIESVALAAEGESVSALQFDVRFDSTRLTLADVEEGAAALVAGKFIGWYLIAPDMARVLVSGLNNTAFPDGDIALLHFVIDASPQAVSCPISLENTMASDPIGMGVEIGGVGGYAHVVGPEAWVQSGYSGAQWGTPTYPFSTVSLGADALDSGGVLRFLAGHSTETPSIAKAMSLTAEEGPVKIGLSSGPPAYTASASDVIVVLSIPDGSSLAPVASSLTPDRVAAASTAADSGDTGTSRNGHAHTVRQAFEPRLPLEEDADGNTLVRPGERAALRLRAQSEINPGSLWTACIGLPEVEVVVEWASADGSGADLWAVFNPIDTVVPGQVLLLVAGGDDSSGAPLQTAAGRFLFVEAGSTALGPALASPRPNVDYLPLAAGEAVIEIAQDGNRLRTATDGPYDPPCRVWIPLPDGVDGAAATMVYRSNRLGTIPGSRVAGWLVPGSAQVLRVEGQDYLGLLIRHGGYLGIE